MTEAVAAGEFYSLSPDQARRYLTNYLKDIKPYGLAWGSDGILSLIAVDIGDHDEVQGSISRDGDYIFYTRNPSTQLERQIRTHGDRVEFDIDALQIGWNLKGQLDPVRRQLQVTGSQNQVPVFETSVNLK